MGRLLRSTEGVGAESHRVAKVAQGGRSEESRRVAESQHIAQASRLGGGGEVLAGDGTLTRASMTRRRDETMEAWHRAGRRGVAVAQAGVARGAVGLRRMWRTWVILASCR